MCVRAHVCVCVCVCHGVSVLKKGGQFFNSLYWLPPLGRLKSVSQTTAHTECRKNKSKHDQSMLEELVYSYNIQVGRRCTFTYSQLTLVLNFPTTHMSILNSRMTSIAANSPQFTLRPSERIHSLSDGISSWILLTRILATGNPDFYSLFPIWSHTIIPAS